MQVAHDRFLTSVISEADLYIIDIDLVQVVE